MNNNTLFNDKELKPDSPSAFERFVKENNYRILSEKEAAELIAEDFRNPLCFVCRYNKATESQYLKNKAKCSKMLESGVPSGVAARTDRGVCNLFAPDSIGH